MGRPSTIPAESRDRLIELDGAGMRKSEIVRRMNSEGLTRADGTAWTQSSVTMAAQAVSPPSMVRRATSLLELAATTGERLDARDAARAAEATAAAVAAAAGRRANDPTVDTSAQTYARRLLDQAQRAQTAASVIVHDAERAVAQTVPAMTRAEAAAVASQAAAAKRNGDRAQGGADGAERSESLPRSVEQARTTHSRIDDERYAEMREEAVESNTPLTRSQLRDEARRLMAEKQAGAAEDEQPPAPRPDQPQSKPAELLVAPLEAFITEALVGDETWVRRLLEVKELDWGIVRRGMVGHLDAVLILVRAELAEQQALADGDA